MIEVILLDGEGTVQLGNRAEEAPGTRWSRLESLQDEFSQVLQRGGTVQVRTERGHVRLQRCTDNRVLVIVEPRSRLQELVH
ncbi:MAG: hypothetical protein ACYCW6_26655, partial [Candidatus Xenobia bacterium]